MQPSTRSTVLDTKEFTQDVQENNYSVSADGMIFQILSSGLYTNEIAACIKEPLSNAQDSHAQAGCPERPVKVHLPTELEPFYSVRDYGVSMTEETVKKVFSAIGKSTKHLEADQIGGFGVGGKSPWSYTEVFTITVYLDGIKTVYVNDYNNHSPKLIKTLEEATQDENGIMISFAVKKCDIRRFLYTYKTITRFMDVKPETNVLVEEHEDVEIVEHTEHKFITVKGVDTENMLPHSFNRHDAVCFALVGNILYPLDASNVFESRLKEIFRDNPLTGAMATTQRIVLKFDVNEIDVLPSREFLDYKSGKTLKSIKSAMRRVESFYQAKVEQVQKECDGMDILTAMEKAKSIIGALNHNITRRFEVDVKHVGLCRLECDDYTNKVREILSTKLRERKLKVNQCFTAVNRQGTQYKLFGNSKRVPERNALPQVSIFGGNTIVYYYSDEPKPIDTLEVFVKNSEGNTFSGKAYIGVHDKELFEYIQDLAPGILIGVYEEMSSEDQAWTISDQNPIMGYSFNHDIAKLKKGTYLYNEFGNKDGCFRNNVFHRDVKRADVKAFVSCWDPIPLQELDKFIPKLAKKNGWRLDQIAMVQKAPKNLNNDPMWKELGLVDVLQEYHNHKFMKRVGIGSLERRTFVKMPSRRHVEIVNETPTLKDCLKKKLGARVVVIHDRDEDAKYISKSVHPSKIRDIDFKDGVFSDVPRISLLQHADLRYIGDESFETFKNDVVSILGDNNVGK